MINTLYGLAEVFRRPGRHAYNNQDSEQAILWAADYIGRLHDMLQEAVDNGGTCSLDLTKVGGLITCVLIDPSEFVVCESDGLTVEQALIKIVNK